MKVGHEEQHEQLKNQLVEMIAAVAVKQTENHLELLALDKARGVEMSGMRADIDQVKADVAQIKADIAQVKADSAQVKADVSSIHYKIAASELAAERRHDSLLNAIRTLRGVPGVSFAM